MNKTIFGLTTFCFVICACSPNDEIQSRAPSPEVDSTVPSKVTEKSKELLGTDKADTLVGGSGNDYLTGGDGADFLNGQEGFDYTRHDNQDNKKGVTVDLVIPKNNRGEAKGDTYLSIEGIIGSLYNDYLKGNLESNDINGLSGDDTLNGGGSGDVYNGGTGSDRFIMVAGQTDGDVILEFDNSLDPKGDNDSIEFYGFGTAPSLVQESKEKWVISSENGEISESFFVKSGSEHVASNYVIRE